MHGRSAGGARATWRGELRVLIAYGADAGAGACAARAFRWILPLHFSLKKPVRISGPLVSSKMATFLSAAAGREGQVQWMRPRGRARYRGAPGRRAAASFTRSIVAPCAAWSPWLKFSRAVFMPASISEVIVGTSQQAGPMVQKIFVFLLWLMVLFRLVGASTVVQQSASAASPERRDARCSAHPATSELADRKCGTFVSLAFDRKTAHNCH